MEKKILLIGGLFIFLFTGNLNASTPTKGSLISDKKIATSVFMADTACTSQTQDTFYINALPNTDAYIWTIPTGANIIATIGDTLIIIDWANSILGSQNICIETMNSCDISAPFCFPIEVIICNTAPIAMDDKDSTSLNTPIYCQCTR